MKFPLKFRVRKGLVSACVTALAFVGPTLAAPRLASAAEGELDHDARLDGFTARNAVLDTGVASDYLLLGAMALLAVGVMFKDAQRSHKKS